MLTGTYGTKIPETGDNGAAFFPALVANAQQFDSHDHDGSDSALIASKNVSRGTVTVGPSGWVLGGIWYAKNVTVPSGYSLATHSPIFLLGNNRIYPKYDFVSNTSFNLSMPLDGQTVTVVFT